jgi:hypothetical protein
MRQMARAIAPPREESEALRQAAGPFKVEIPVLYEMFDRNLRITPSFKTSN